MEILKSANPVEKILFWCIAYTWVLYGFGGLYILGPVLGWSLFMIACGSLYLGPAAPSHLRATGPVPLSVWLWMVGMGVMLIALWIGHANFDLGALKTIKSTVGWAKGWALLALFLFIGAVLPIRREVLIRGQSIVALQTLLLLPVFLSAPMIGLPEVLFVSPLKVLGGAGPEYFTVYLYTIDPANGVVRWQFYAPWSPFAGLLSVVLILCGLEEKDTRWKAICLITGVAMVLMCRSRMTFLGVVACAGAAWLIPLAARSLSWYFGAFLTALGVFFVERAYMMVMSFVDGFKAARVNSSIVRETLQRIAKERWWSEAKFFGHGTVDAGDILTAYMPIGSHHTWFGLLFVKGLVGFVALLVPMVVSTVEMMIFAIRRPEGRLPFGLLLSLIFFSLGENLEVQVYMFWPAMVLIGIGARQWWAYRLYVLHKLSEKPEGSQTVPAPAG